MHICTNTILHCGVKKRNFDQLLNFVALHTSPYSLITAKLGTKERSILCQNSPPPRGEKAREFGDHFQNEVDDVGRPHTQNPNTVEFSRRTSFGSRVVSVLDSGAEGPGSNRSLRLTVHTHHASDHQAAKLAAALLMAAGLLRAWRKVMAANHRVYDSRHPLADCQQPGSAPEPYAG